MLIMFFYLQAPCTSTSSTSSKEPISPVQLLWLNLIMDTFAALALATELPDDAQLLSRGPEPRTASMISNAMRTNIMAQGIFQLFVVDIKKHFQMVCLCTQCVILTVHFSPSHACHCPGNSSFVHSVKYFFFGFKLGRGGAC